MEDNQASKGIQWNTSAQRWRITWTFKKTPIYFGAHDDLASAEAALSRLKAESVKHKTGASLRAWVANLPDSPVRKIVPVSKYRGVIWIQRDRRWRVSVKAHGKAWNLGSFDTEDDAGALARRAFHMRESMTPKRFAEWAARFKAEHRAGRMAARTKTNEVIVRGDYVEIVLRGVRSRGKKTLIDVADLPRVENHSWFLNNTGYARRTSETKNGSGPLLHRVVMGLGPSDSDPRRVDHINRDRLDNRRANLRIVTPGQNAQNVGNRAKSGSQCQFRGVNRVVLRTVVRFVAYVTVAGKLRFHKRFKTEVEAAAAASQARFRLMPFSNEPVLILVNGKLFSVPRPLAERFRSVIKEGVHHDLHRGHDSRKSNQRV